MEYKKNFPTGGGNWDWWIKAREKELDELVHTIAHTDLSKEEYALIKQRIKSIRDRINRHKNEN